MKAVKGVSADDEAAASATVGTVQAADVAHGQAAAVIAPPKKIRTTSAHNQKTRRGKEKYACMMASCLHQQEMQNKDKGKSYTSIEDTSKK
jgi:hypothetical protein